MSSPQQQQQLARAEYDRQLALVTPIPNLTKNFTAIVRKILGDTIFIGQVAALNGDRVQILRPGQLVADGTFYTAAPGIAPALNANDYVFCVHLGASFFVVCRIAGSTTASAGKVTLPAQAAGTYSVTVANPNVTAASLIQVTTVNLGGDTTAGRRVVAWCGAVIPGVSFAIEYNTTATMAASWQALYRIL